MTQAEVLLMKDDVILCFDICLVLEFSCKSRRKCSCLHGENPKISRGEYFGLISRLGSQKEPVIKSMGLLKTVPVVSDDFLTIRAF